MIALAPDFRHLAFLTDDIGLLEHARHAVPRLEHGYCTDDAARGLVVTSRETELDAGMRALNERYFGFLLRAQDRRGAFHNRLSTDNRWLDNAGMGDWWGRALWGFGTAAAGNPDMRIRRAARAAFDRSAHHRSAAPHTMAFAGLGAVQILRGHPDDVAAAALLRDAVEAIGVPDNDSDWYWPLPRLTYANAALAEVIISAGHLFDEQRLRLRGLRMLSWLCTQQYADSRLSMIPVAGWGRGEHRHTFDQQPIEVAALADACATAAAVTGDSGWEDWARLAVAWFHGNNDVLAPMSDPLTGGGYDGLTPTGANLNQGAESTLALIATLQHARRLSMTGAAHA
jgi:hypothetical protein